ncbi:uncharacterized protein LOC118185167 [Stegodyphus dumicola]|uniref:uncharacterized protein LOC118185167 n=1 Tax=Stegodyphus dumicola TaxID=202533 RepID=UPI0015A88218|nr:uncharacterized protein LOC118185167 [Stegodyphus dumicola]
MPDRCCVPLCKGNYPTGPKLSVFSFPKNEDLKIEWLSAIQRKDFSPKKSSKVCELHFKESDFKVEASAFDSKNGILISAPLQVRRLKENTVPSIFKDYPSVYSSKSSTIVREDPDAKKKTARECHNLQKALRESLKEYEMYNNDLKINCSNDILSCIDRYGIAAVCHTVPDTSTVCFIHIVFSPGPSTDYSIVVNGNQEMSVFIKKNLLHNFLLTYPGRVGVVSTGSCLPEVTH